MLLVDHDQGEVADRREHRRARPDADARLTVAQAQPLVAALARRQGGVQDRDPVTEPGPEPGHRLRREADLGDEDDRPPPPRQRRLDGGEVDLGLARPGDPVDQQLPRRPGLAPSSAATIESTAALCSASSGGGEAAAVPTRVCPGRRRTVELRVTISPRSSSLRST